MESLFNQVRKARRTNVVMVIDDDRYVRSIIRNAFDDMGEVIDLKSGEQLLETYQKSAPDLVLLDIHVPGKDGKLLLREIIGMDPEAFVIMISSDAVPENVRQTHLAGAKGFVVKPFSCDTLMKQALRCPTFRFEDQPK